jgi:hypothetical protein
LSVVPVEQRDVPVAAHALSEPDCAGFHRPCRRVIELLYVGGARTSAGQYSVHRDVGDQYTAGESVADPFLSHEAAVCIDVGQLRQQVVVSADQVVSELVQYREVLPTAIGSRDVANGAVGTEVGAIARALLGSRTCRHGVHAEMTR